MKYSNLGEFEEVVLLTVGALQKEAYGISIKEEIEKRMGRNVSIGALHTALQRLEDKGFLKSRMADSDEKRRGRRKKYVEITAQGKEALLEIYELRHSLLKSIPNIQLP